MGMHRVRQGECLSSIAYHYGFADWHQIYDHPRNAEFKRKRPNPNLIYPGDELYIPELQQHEEACQTAQRHRFRVTLPPTYLNIRIQDPAQQPIANVPYNLRIATREVEGQTDNDGWIREQIPAWAQSGWLTVWPNPLNLDEAIKWEVKPGYLDPLETTTGVKARLMNLGYDCGDINDVEDEKYESAVRQFQQDNGLTVDGTVDPPTRNRLRQEHRV
jgi:N-acetylmuramoyl-L-alanine amidase